MRTYCKGINPSDVETILPFVWECFDGKWKRNDYAALLTSYCAFGKREIREIALERDYSKFEPAIRGIATDITERIQNRDLHLAPVLYQQRVDGITHKLREIGLEEPFQQVCEHVAVGCLSELFKAKLNYYQCASVKGKGQLFGAKSIQRWIKEDLFSAEYAEKHGQKCHRTCRYHVKLDIRKCYPSMKREVVMRLLERDIHKNPTLLWFVDALLQNHLHGFVIGSLLSQHLCNYMLSYAYREACGYTKTRRGKEVRLLSRALFYMDDMLFIGSDRRNVKMAVGRIVKYMQNTFQLTIKENWHIKDWEQEPIDMMGFKIYGDGHMEIRANIFLRSRRSFKMAEDYITIKRARRVTSYKGYYKYTDSATITKALGIDEISAAAESFISHYEKEEHKS